MLFFIIRIDKFFHNSPGTEMCLGTPHFTEKHAFFCRLSPAFPVRFKGLRLFLSMAEPLFVILCRC